MTDHTSPPLDGNTPEEGLTIWLTLYSDVTGTARAGLVRNPDGTTSVAIDTRAGMNQDSADEFGTLVKHLGQVATLGHSLEVPSDSPIKSTESVRAQVAYDLTALRHMVLQTISPSLVQTRHAGKKLNRAERRERDLRRTIARKVGTVFDIDKVKVQVQSAATAAGEAYVKQAASQQQEGAAVADLLAAHRVAAEIGASVKDLGPACGREARAAVVSSHLMGLSFSDNPETRDASLILSSLSSLEVGFELTERAKDPSKCSVDDLGVRLAAPDHVIEALDGLSRHASLFGKVVRNLVHETSPSVDGGSNPTVGDGQVAGVETAAPATDANKITVTPEVIEAVAEHLFDTGVETPMINNLRSIAACLRNDLDDPVEVAASVDPTSRSHALFSQLADAIEEENERKRVFHSAQRTQVVAAKRFEDASSAVQEIELQIRRLATGEQA